jgi:hypothetical protein
LYLSRSKSSSSLRHSTASVESHKSAGHQQHDGGLGHRVQEIRCQRGASDFDAVRIDDLVADETKTEVSAYWSAGVVLRDD